MKNTYSQIWNYLAGKLSPKEEEELMAWMGESDRNIQYFDQIVQDFNEINSSPSVKRNNFSWYWTAASILLFLAFSLWFFNPFSSDEPPYSIQLPDGSTVTLGHDSDFEYDSISFASTKWIKISGLAEITTPDDEHLLIETENGYLMLEGKSSLQIRDLRNEDMEVFVEEGNIRWLNPSVTAEELAFVGGEKMLFKSDGKTVLFNNSPKAQKSLLIFDNYMNL